MKHMKDRAVSEMNELRRQNKELQERLGGMEEEMGRIRESVSHTSLKLGASSVHDSTTSISSRGRPSQQSGTASSVKRSPSLSQVCTPHKHVCTINRVVSPTKGFEVSNGAIEGGRL